MVERNKVAAEEAMMSAANINELIQNKLNFIVGTGLANMFMVLLDQMNKSLTREDGKSICIKTDMGFLICSFSFKRYGKDKCEIEKQIQRAKQVVSKHIARRTEISIRKFIDESKKVLDRELLNQLHKKVSIRANQCEKTT